MWRKTNWEWTVECSFSNSEPRGKDGLKKEVYLFFLDDINNMYVIFIRTTGIKKRFSASQRQAIIKLILKRM